MDEFFIEFFCVVVNDLSLSKPQLIKRTYGLYLVVLPFIMYVLFQFSSFNGCLIDFVARKSFCKIVKIRDV